MVRTRHPSDPAPLEVIYAPQLRHHRLPVEVVSRAELIDRIAGRELASRQRTDFHQLVVCTGGEGRHQVDYQSIEMARGTLLRIYPGQVQQFVPEPAFEASIVVWPIESHHADPEASTWFPGSTAPTCWQLDDERLAKVLTWLGELQEEQDRFDASPRRIALMKAILCSMLLRLALEIPESTVDDVALPVPYVAYRQLIEERLFERPTVSALAQQLGYSSRTLDRACQQVSGQTARQVLDQRIALEIRRLLTHTRRPLAAIALDFGFSDPSNFSKFVKRHIGRLPGAIRSDPTGR